MSHKKVREALGFPGARVTSQTEEVVSLLSEVKWAAITEAHAELVNTKSAWLEAKEAASDAKKAYDTAVEALSHVLDDAIHPPAMPLFDRTEHAVDIDDMLDADATAGEALDRDDDQ